MRGPILREPPVRTAGDTGEDSSQLECNHELDSEIGTVGDAVAVERPNYKQFVRLSSN